MKNESIEMASKNRTTPTTNERKSFTLNKMQWSLVIFVSSLIIIGGTVAAIALDMKQRNANETKKEKLKILWTLKF